MFVTPAFERTPGLFGAIPHLRSPVWHRLLRKKRSRARKAAHVGLATRAQLALLEAHHGSDIPMSPSTWKCRTCSTVNWSTRRTCRHCQSSPERENSKRDRKKSQERDFAEPLAAYEGVTDASRARLVATLRHISRQLSNESMPEDARSSLRFRLQTVKDELDSQDPLPVRVSKLQSAIARAEASLAKKENALFAAKQERDKARSPGVVPAMCLGIITPRTSVRRVHTTAIRRLLV